MTNVIVTSENRIKTEAVRQAFTNYYPNVVAIESKCESNVSRQPFYDDVFNGAKNRIENLKKSTDISKYDFIVSCEGGIIKQFGTYFNLQLVLLEELKMGKKGIGTSAGVPIPDKYVELMMQTSFAEVSDHVFDGKGGVGKLTNNVLSRQALIFQATTMALTQIINKCWEEDDSKW